MANDKTKPARKKLASRKGGYENLNNPATDSDSDSDETGNSSGSSSGHIHSSSSTTSLTAAAENYDQENATQEPSDTTRSHCQHRRRHRYCHIQMLLAVISQIGLFVFFGIMAGVIVKAPWVYPYSWHPIFMGLYGFIATEAILLLQPVEKGSQKRIAKTIHGLLHLLAFIFSLVGFVAIYANKDRRNKPHFQSNHALFGCAAMLVFFLQIVFGIAVAYAPRRFFQQVGYARTLRIHRVAGYFSIALLWISLWLSVLTNWMNRNFAGHEWIFALSMGMIAVGLVGQVTPSRLFSSRKRTLRCDTNS
ncbi:hypothetical protein BGZ51_009659 [Haplosporangium sp. Z 767]|nr:hypothetical protein BGZ51_009659 [Haplosporangium sp. Z 767]KAF9191989.1 hypothetical protein BGZ50_008934 [Haplosporangium sp. Z 11]